MPWEAFSSPKAVPQVLQVYDDGKCAKLSPIKRFFFRNPAYGEKNLSTDAESRTDTIFVRLHDLSKKERKRRRKKLSPLLAATFGRHFWPPLLWSTFDRHFWGPLLQLLAATFGVHF